MCLLLAIIHLLRFIFCIIYEPNNLLQSSGATMRNFVVVG